jgi:hypothetical protein
MGNALFSVPAFVLGKGVSLLVDAEWREAVIRVFYFSTNSFALAFIALGLFRICVNVELTAKKSLVLSLLMTFGTCLVSTARMGFAEPMTGLFLLWAFVEMTRGFGSRETGSLVRRPRLSIIGLFLGCAVMMRPSALIFVPIVGISAVLTNGFPFGRSLHRLVIGLSGPGLLIGLSNLWRFGNVFETGYPTLRYTTPWYEGMIGQWISPGKGLLWYAPLAVMFFVAIPRLWKNFRVIAIMSAAVVVGNTAIFSRFEIWSGDNAYGPRYLTIVLPFMLGVTIFAVRQEFSGWTRLLAVVGFLVNAGGNLLYLNAVYYRKLPEIVSHLGSSANDPNGGYDWEKVREVINFVPRFSQWKMHLELLPSAIQTTWSSIISPRSETPPFSAGVMQSLSWYSAEVRLDTWWSHWIASGAPPQFLALALIPLTLIGLSFRLIREERRPRASKE